LLTKHSLSRGGKTTEVFKLQRQTVMKKEIKINEKATVSAFFSMLPFLMALV